MWPVEKANIERLMKRLQSGSSGYGRDIYQHANDLHAECYGTVGRLYQEKIALARSLRRTLEAFERNRAGYSLGYERETAICESARRTMDDLLGKGV